MGGLPWAKQIVERVKQCALASVRGAGEERDPARFRRTVAQNVPERFRQLVLAQCGRIPCKDLFRGGSVGTLARRMRATNGSGLEQHIPLGQLLCISVDFGLGPLLGVLNVLYELALVLVRKQLRRDRSVLLNIPYGNSSSSPSWTRSALGLQEGPRIHTGQKRTQQELPERQVNTDDGSEIKTNTSPTHLGNELLVDGDRTLATTPSCANACGSPML